MLNDGEGGGVGPVVVVVCGECRVGGEPSACSVEADSGGWGGESDGGGGFAGCEAFPDGQGEEFPVGLVQLCERGVDGVVGGGVGWGAVDGLAGFEPLMPMSMLPLAAITTSGTTKAARIAGTASRMVWATRGDRVRPLSRPMNE